MLPQGVGPSTSAGHIQVCPPRSWTSQKFKDEFTAVNSKGKPGLSEAQWVWEGGVGRGLDKRRIVGSEAAFKGTYQQIRLSRTWYQWTGFTKDRQFEHGLKFSKLFVSFTGPSKLWGTRSERLLFHFFTRWRKVWTPPALHCFPSAFQFILLALWPIGICFALLFVSLYPIDWLCCSVRSPVLAGVALGVIGLRLLGHFSHSSGDRRKKIRQFYMMK